MKTSWFRGVTTLAAFPLAALWVLSSALLAAADGRLIYAIREYCGHKDEPHVPLQQPPGALDRVGDMEQSANQRLDPR